MGKVIDEHSYLTPADKPTAKVRNNIRNHKFSQERKELNDSGPKGNYANIFL